VVSKPGNCPKNKKPISSWLFSLFFICFFRKIPGESHMSHEKINPTWWIWCHPSDEAVPVFFQMVPPRSGNLMGI